MAVKTIGWVALASVKTVNDLAIASVKTVIWDTVSTSNGLLTWLRAYYKTDESSWNAADSTANAYTLTAKNGATFAAWILNNWASLDGINDYFSTTSNLGMAWSSQNYSVVFWIKPPITIVTQQVFWNHNQAANDTFEYVEFLTSNVRHVRVRQWVAADICSVAQTFTWWSTYMVCATYNGSNLTVSVNAWSRTSLASIWNGTAGWADWFTLWAYIGGWAYYSSIIDEIAVFDRFLTTADESVIYNGGSPLPFASYN